MGQKMKKVESKNENCPTCGSEKTACFLIATSTNIITGNIIRCRKSFICDNCGEKFDISTYYRGGVHLMGNIT